MEALTIRSSKGNKNGIFIIEQDEAGNIIFVGHRNVNQPSQKKRRALQKRKAYEAAHHEVTEQDQNQKEILQKSTKTEWIL
jgi:hypothetical protein